MRILHIVGYYPGIGGPCSVVDNLNSILKRNGHYTGIATPIQQNNKHYFDNSTVDELIYVKVKKSYFSRFWPYYCKKWNNYIQKFLTYDLIHIHGVFDYYAYFVSSKIDKPYIITLHGTLQPEVITKKSSLRKRLFRSLFGLNILRKARFVHALTPYEKECLIELGVPEEKVVVIPNGINPDDFRDLPEKGLIYKKFPRLRDKKLVLFLSRINWKKGLDDLIPAFAEVVKQVKDAHLLLVGPDNEGYIDRVNSWIKDYKLSEYVTYFGPAYGRDKLMFLQDSNIFVLPSYSEGFPMSVIEAMYMGLPVVVTENIGIPEIIRESSSGIIVKKKQNEIADALINLFKDMDKAKEMGEMGRQYIMNNLTIDKAAERMIEIYEKILCGKG